MAAAAAADGAPKKDVVGVAVVVPKGEGAAAAAVDNPNVNAGAVPVEEEEEGRGSSAIAVEGAEWSSIPLSSSFSSDKLGISASVSVGAAVGALNEKREDDVDAPKEKPAAVGADDDARAAVDDGAAPKEKGDAAGLLSLGAVLCQCE